MGKKWFNRMKELTEVQMAYLAGFFDGEGCITINLERGGSHNLTITVGQTDRLVLDRIQNMTGIGTVHRVARKKLKRTHKIAYQWRVTGRAAEAFIRVIYDYLDVKKPEACVALKFRGTFVNIFAEYRSDFPCGSQAAKEKREEYRLLLKHIKRLDWDNVP